MNEKKTTSGQIRQHTIQLVRELEVFKDVFLATGYTLSQSHLLFELSIDKTLGLMELADKLLMDKSNTSRTVKKLRQLGLVKSEKSTSDGRQKMLSLTLKGERALQTMTALADGQIEHALQNLNEDQQPQVIRGLQLYTNALSKSRQQRSFTIRPIQKRDDTQIAQVIRDVMTEFNAVGEGYSINDPEVDSMFSNYRDRQSIYFVIARDEKIVGGGGIGPLKGGDKLTCELQKMFFLPEARGMGLGRRLLLLLMNEARKRGYKKCYLETLERMKQAIELYLKNGFEPLEKPLGKTGHCSCDRWYSLNL